MKRFVLALGMLLAVVSSSNSQVATRKYMSYQQTYNSTTTYSKGDVVSVGAATYVSLIDSNVNHAPATSNADWLALGSGSTASPYTLPSATPTVLGGVTLANGQSGATLAKVASTGNYTDLAGLPAAPTPSSIGAVAKTGDSMTGPLTVNGGGGGQIQVGEGIAPSGIVSASVLYAETASHRLKVIMNNAITLTLVGIQAPGTTGNCAKIGASGFDIVDAGAPCGSGSGGSYTLPAATPSTLGGIQLALGQSGAVLSTVASTGSYNDLANLPAAPTPASIGAVAKTGDTMSGPLTFSDGSGGAGAIQLTEGVVPSGVAVSSVIYSDPTSHRVTAKMNNGSAITLAGLTAAGTSGNCAKFGPSGFDLIDTGTPCSSEHVVSFSATPTFVSTATSNIITLTGNVASSTLAAGTSGQLITMTICQDATGGRTFSWPTNMRGTITIGSTASKCNVQNFTYSNNQSAWLATSTGVINE